ncbi:MAG: hypothetical protein AAF226_08915, partial [Verrucomicrobiota bacterium]
MSTLERTIFLIGFSLFSIIGVAIFLFSFQRANSTPWLETNHIETTINAWSYAFSNLQGDTPEQSNQHGELWDLQSYDDLTAQEEVLLAQNNQFVLTSHLLLWLGFFGFAFKEMAQRRAQPAWVIWLRRLGFCGGGLLFFLVIGFYTALTADTRLLIPLPGSDDLFSWMTMSTSDYSMAGVHPWNDFLSITALGLFSGILILGFCGEGLKTLPATLIACGLSTIIFPITCSWVWGSGWLSFNLNAMDFAGGSIIHTVTGAAAIPIALGLFFAQKKARLLNPTAIPDDEYPKKSTLWLAVALPLIILAFMGSHLSSFLEAKPEVGKAAVTILLSCLTCGMGACLWAIRNPHRSIIELFLLGAIGGAVLVSANIETASQVIVIPMGLIMGA